MEFFVNFYSGRKSNKYVVVVSLVQPFLVPSSPGSEEQLSKLVHPPFWHHTICLSFWQGLTCVTFSWSKDKTASSILGTKANFAFFCFCFFAAFLQSVTRSCLEIMVEIMEKSDIARFGTRFFTLKVCHRSNLLTQLLDVKIVDQRVKSLIVSSIAMFDNTHVVNEIKLFKLFCVIYFTNSI